MSVYNSLSLLHATLLKSEIQQHPPRRTSSEDRSPAVIILMPHVLERLCPCHCHFRYTSSDLSDFDVQRSFKRRYSDGMSTRNLLVDVDFEELQVFVLDGAETAQRSKTQLMWKVVTCLDNLCDDAKLFDIATNYLGEEITQRDDLVGIVHAADDKGGLYVVGNDEGAGVDEHVWQLQGREKASDRWVEEKLDGLLRFVDGGLLCLIEGILLCIGRDLLLGFFGRLLNTALLRIVDEFLLCIGTLDKCRSVLKEE